MGTCDVQQFTTSEERVVVLGSECISLARTSTRKGPHECHRDPIEVSESVSALGAPGWTSQQQGWNGWHVVK